MNLLRRTRGRAALRCFLAAAATCGAAAPLRASPPPPFQPLQGRLDPTQDPPQADVLPVLREYDRFQDKTTLKVEGVRPQITRGDSRLFLTATSVSDGVEVSRPEKVAINILSVADEFQYADTRDDLTLIMLVNGTRVKAPARFLKAGVSKDRAQKCLESFVVILPADVLVKLATVDGIEAQLGINEFKIGPVEKASLRRFAEALSLVEPLPPEAGLARGPMAAGELAYRLAQSRADAAQQRFDDAMASCMTRLEATRDYQDAVNEVKRLEANKDRTPAGPARTEASQAWLEAKSRVGLMKSSALLTDEGLVAARRELNDAQGNLHAMHRPLDRGGNGSFVPLH